ncbi:uncharacterized protein LOC132749723 [Ruditapes philippinarum]|uniref:uncharacterized protein LOC132749723 n=1 Tax=Ruditapes philippinarum TaxID=129788 RepID=UPI00295A985B|nr:uncharacterized protein LOC132749723 [Ruditapes philippinarum]
MMMETNMLKAKKCKLLTICILLFAVKGVLAEYHMQNFCNDELSFIWETIYQAKLDLSDDNIYDTKSDIYPYDRLGFCEMSLEAWITRYPKFMFYFDYLNLDCDDGHLEFYIGESNTGYANITRVSGLQGNICGTDKPVGVFAVDMQHFRIKYVPKRRQSLTNLFSIIITSYGDGSCPSYGHVCKNSRCIDGDIACNGYDSCGDDSGCDLGTAAIVGIVIGGVAGLAMIISLAVCCFCCMKRSGIKAGTIQNLPTSGANPNVYNQVQVVNQGSPYTYPDVNSTNVVQQSNIRPIYGFNP